MSGKRVNRYKNFLLDASSARLHMGEYVYFFEIMLTDTCLMCKSLIKAEVQWLRERTGAKKLNLIANN